MIQKTLSYLRANALPTALEQVAIMRHRLHVFALYVHDHHRRRTEKYDTELREIIEPSEGGERIVHEHAVLLARARVMRDRVGLVASSVLFLTIVGVPTLFIKVVDSHAAHVFGIRHLNEGDIPDALGGAFGILLLMFLPSSFLQRNRFSRLLIGSTSFCRLWEGIVFVLALAYGALFALPWHPVQFLAMFVPCGVIVAASAVVITANYCVDLVGVAYPDSYPLTCLLVARREISGWSATTEIRERTSAAQEIEAAANHILRFWPRELRNLDNATNKWFAAQCRNLVTHFVAAEREILWANDGFARARDYIDVLIRAFVTDGLIDLATTPRTDVEAAEHDSYVKQIKSVITGVLPLATLEILHVLKLPIPQNVLPWVTFGAFVWGLIAILSLIDPELERRLSLSRGVLDFKKSLFP